MLQTIPTLTIAAIDLLKAFPTSSCKHPVEPTYRPRSPRSLSSPGRGFDRWVLLRWSSKLKRHLLLLYSYRHRLLCLFAVSAWYACQLAPSAWIGLRECVVGVRKGCCAGSFWGFTMAEGGLSSESSGRVARDVHGCQ